jgi:hypothetical protein
VPGWTRPDLLRVVGRGPARARCLEVVELVLAAAESCGPGPLDEQLRGRPFGFTAEGLGLARGVLSRSDDLELEGLERVFFHVGLGMSRAFGARLAWPEGPLALLQADGLGFASALHRPGRALRLEPPPGADPRWFAHGVGRASWFLAAGSPSVLPELLADPDTGRIEGLGLASVFNGGAPPEVEASLLRRAGAGRPALERGRAFGAWLRSPEVELPGGLYAAFAEDSALRGRP